MKLSTYAKKGIALSISKGFTLIELLVVIAIIGILAAALIATIDPLEQIKKANDTTRKNTAVEYTGAVARYYGTKQGFPWNAAPIGAGCNGAVAPSGLTLSSGGVLGCIDAMILEGELKSGFRDTATGQVGVDITTSSNLTKTVACFDPQSRSGSSDPTAKYTNIAEALAGSSTCTPGPTATCLWCAQ